MLLPCNVTVSQEEDGRTLVSIIDPLAMMGFLVDPALDEVAQEANKTLKAGCTSFGQLIKQRIRPVAQSQTSYPVGT